MTKNLSVAFDISRAVYHTIYVTIYHMLLMVHLCKMMIFQGLFPFFKKKIKNLWDVKERESMIEGVKGKKFVQTEKRFCLSRPIPQEPYIT